jgi:cellulose synthase/poly-beta-1,6-N-acetylglucosamine synthase-like glycosyltransferase
VFRRRIDSKPVRGVYRSRTHAGLVVADKENGGKADALNVGLNVASGELVCAIDADTIIEPDALLRMARPFLTRDDVVAAGGTIRVVNGSIVRGGRVITPRAPARLLPGIQAVEYLRAFLFGRLGWNLLGGNLIISGAFGMFRRETLLQTGGYLHDTVGEDMEIVARLRRHGVLTGAPNRIHFVPDPVAWTEVPSTLRVLGRQRDRWHRGLADVLWRHRAVIGNPRYGVLGVVTFPYFLIELVGPVIELLGLVAIVAALVTGSVTAAFGGLFFLVSYGYGMVLATLALVMAEFSDRRYQRVRDRLLLFLWAAVESFGYRQLTVLWRLRGLWSYLRGSREWGAMARTGFTAPDAGR